MIASRSDRREESKIDGALLVIFAGLPGTGKTTIARALARDLADIPAARLLTWQEVASREYEGWDREHIVIDTAGRSIPESVQQLREALLFALEP